MRCRRRRSTTCACSRTCRSSASRRAAAPIPRTSSSSRRAERGFYTIQVTGYNGATSPDPYMLRVATAPPRPTSTVPPRTITGTAGPALPATLPTGLNTVFLVNRRQLEGIYGSTGATNVMTALANDSAAFTSLGFPNVTLSVDTLRRPVQARVRRAGTRIPGDPAAANGVVQAINGVVDSKIRSQPNGAGPQVHRHRRRRPDHPVRAARRLHGHGRERERLREHVRAGHRPLRVAQRRADALRRPVRRRRPRAVPQPAALHAGARGRPARRDAGGHRRHAQPLRRADGQRAARPDDVADDRLRLPLRRRRAINGCMRTRFADGRDARCIDNPAARRRLVDDRAAVGAFLPTTGAAPSITSLNGHASHYQFQAAGRHDVARTRGALLTTATLTGIAGGADEPARLQHGLPRRPVRRRRDRDRRRREHARLAAGVRAEGRRRVPRQHRLRLRRQPRRRVLGGAEPAVRAEHRRRLDGRQRDSSPPSRRTSASSASSASTTRRRWRSSRSTACRCGASRTRAAAPAHRGCCTADRRPRRRDDGCCGRSTADAAAAHADSQ